MAWSFCNAPKPLTEDNVVSNACVGDGPGVGDAAPLSRVGVGVSVTARTPSKGCSVFGPDVGSMGLRPRDPDTTGGYYQPLLATLAGAGGGGDAIELARIHCDLANASGDTVTQFAKLYHDNQEPDAAAADGDAGRGGGIALGHPRVGPRRAAGELAGGVGRDVRVLRSPGRRRSASQREAMQVAWYGSGGTLDTESTGRAGDDPATTSQDAWTAPAQAGTVHLWVVLRDSRGGVDYVSQDVVVTQ